MENNNKEMPCGASFYKSIDVDVRGENNQETINQFISQIKDKTKSIKSNMIILKCQIYPVHFFDLNQEE